tara:strand:+ start:1361 stop:2977 length:1617 start_codon:yes stop_codon:yes gene_type:complete
MSNIPFFNDSIVQIDRKKIYGYNFTEQNSGGLGAIIHDVMNAAKYATQNGFILGFVKDGYDIPRLNGSYDDTPATPNKCWHSYFTSFPIVEESDCIEVWPEYVPGTIAYRDLFWDKCKMSHFLKETVCTFNVNIRDEINDLVRKTPFNAETDLVVHIRLTEEKKIETPVFLPIENYISECELGLKVSKLSRIYICTDDQTACHELWSHFECEGIEVVWDETEPSEPIQTIRWQGQLKKSIAQQETMNAFKNIHIMASAKYLIGGRMSYFYRIAELLNFPNTSVNIQDNDMFGVAPYSDVNYMIRPYKSKTIPNFVSECISDFESYNKTYTNKGIVTIPNFVSDEVVTSIRPELETYKWWTYANIPHKNQWKVNYETYLSESARQSCKYAYEAKQFTYRFRRCLGNHYETCSCVSCRLNDTVESWPFTETLCKITGHRNIRPGEVFISNYGKGDFLSMHHDKDKGDIAVTISFTYDWDPIFGGVLHLCDKDHKIHTSVTPKAGEINIFKLDPNNLVNHFVSPVVVDKNRYTLVAWYHEC